MTFMMLCYVSLNGGGGGGVALTVDGFFFPILMVDG